MLLFGSGGHSKVVLDCLRANEIKVEGIFDDHPISEQHYGIQVIGTYMANILPQESIIITIGKNMVRSNVSKRVKHNFGKVAHPTAAISTSSKFGEGSVIFHLSIVQADTTIGNHAIVNSGAIIEHDCSIGDFVHVSPHATICGEVNIGEGTWVGAGATIVPGVNVGSWCVIGAGAVVLNDVPDNSLVMGVPGVVVKKLNPSEL